MQRLSMPFHRFGSGFTAESQRAQRIEGIFSAAFCVSAVELFDQDTSRY
jgi:hypothetical protein